MSRFLRTLSKIGLVELDPDEHARVHGGGQTPEPTEETDVDQLLKETEALLRDVGPAKGAANPGKATPSPANAPAEPKAAAPAPVMPASSLLEGRPFSEIYAVAEVPPSPFPAEKLARLLDGLRAMEPAMRKAAVMAMDAADDNWAITDPLQDAQRKVLALQEARGLLRDAVSAAEGETAQEMAEAEEHQRTATERIRAEIAELEALLQQELTAVAERKATAQAKLHGTREAASREAARLDGEISTLNALLATFAPPF